MSKYSALDSDNDELDHLIRLHIEAMDMVIAIYGNSLSHEEFMDKTEEFFCQLLEEEKYKPALA